MVIVVIGLRSVMVLGNLPVSNMYCLLKQIKELFYQTPTMCRCRVPTAQVHQPRKFRRGLFRAVPKQSGVSVVECSNCIVFRCSVFTFQEITTSIARRLLTVLYDVTMRSSLTFLIFGLGDTVGQGLKILNTI